MQLDSRSAIKGFSFGDSYSMGLYDGQHLAWKHEAASSGAGRLQNL